MSLKSNGEQESQSCALLREVVISYYREQLGPLLVRGATMYTAVP